MNALCNISSTYLKGRNTFFLFVKKSAFFLHSSLMQRKLANDSLLATKHNFEALEFILTKTKNDLKPSEAT